MPAARFSTYAYAEVWDGGMHRPPHMTATYDAPLRDQDLAVLREQFVAGPRTYGWAAASGVLD
jgi:hypothetical protein